MSFFLLLKNVEIKHASVLASNYCASAAPIMAISLFGHAMGLETGLQPIGVGVIHHDAQFLSDSPDSGNANEIVRGEKQVVHLKRFKTRSFHQRKSATYINEKDYAHRTFLLALQPIATAHLRLSLVFEFAALPDIDLVSHFLRGARIAGGRVERYEFAKAFSAKNDAIFDEIPGNGYWLIDRRDLVDSKSPDESFINALSRQDLGILTPLVTGYALTSEPVSGLCGTRSLSNGDFPAHAFAEPMVGLAQYVPVRQYHDTRIPLWRAGWLSSNLYLATQED